VVPAPVKKRLGPVISEKDQQRRTCAAFRQTNLSLYELWLRYVGLGGNAGEEEVDAYLYSSLLLPAFERDMLSHAVNEFIEEQPAPPRAPYSSEGPGGT
jgi:hypothetical protein